MKAIGFMLVDATNPNTGEVVRKLRVTFDNSSSLPLLTDETVETIKASRDEFLAKVDVREGEFGKYCLFTKFNVIDKF